MDFLLSCSANVNATIQQYVKPVLNSKHLNDLVVVASSVVVCLL